MDEKVRCSWANKASDYHDNVWGVPVRNEERMFEFLSLSGCQAGLSWNCVYGKREAFRKAFKGFDVDTVAAMTESDVSALLINPGIVRNKLKISSIINNANAIIRLRPAHGSLTQFLWNFVGGEPVVGLSNKVTTPLSDDLSKTLKGLGFKFVGSTIVQAFIQTVGVYNAHEERCFRACHSAVPARKKAESLRPITSIRKSPRRRKSDGVES